MPKKRPAAQRRPKKARGKARKHPSASVNGDTAARRRKKGQKSSPDPGASQVNAGPPTVKSLQDGARSVSFRLDMPTLTMPVAKYRASVLGKEPKDVIKETGIHESLVSDYLNGKRKLKGHLEIMAKALRFPGESLEDTIKDLQRETVDLIRSDVPKPITA